MKRAQQLARAARVAFDEFARVETRAGDIAASATGDAHFGERVRGRFVQGDFGGCAVLRTRLGAGDGGEISRGAAAGDYDALWGVRGQSLMLNFSSLAGVSGGVAEARRPSMTTFSRVTFLM